MRNLKVTVSVKESCGDLIRKLSDLEGTHPTNSPFCFSAIMTKDKEEVGKEQTYTIKFNILVAPREKSNVFTITEIAQKLYFNHKEDENITYVMPPLETYMSVFKPNLYNMVNKAYKHYANLIPDKEELMAILMYSLVKLYNKGYYLHNSLIYKSFINELNMEIRKLKYHENDISIDEQVNSEEGTTTVGDLIPDQEETFKAYSQYHYTDIDYWEEMFNFIKKDMLKEMSQLSFDRILKQLETKTIDNRTAKLLMKYREKYNPDYSPRPNRKRDNTPIKPHLKGENKC